MNSSLFKKYNIAGPRYTSYPALPNWSAPPTQGEWFKSIPSNNFQIYIHLPFCNSGCYYCGCFHVSLNKVNADVSDKRSMIDSYIEDLLQEWKIYKEHVELAAPSGIHLGGGTPTQLSPMQLERLLKGILISSNSSSFSFGSVEVDPRITTKEHLEILARYGFHKISIGVQDLHPTVQEIIGRKQSIDTIAKVVENSRSLGFTSINFDFIYGFPGQSLQTIEYNIKELEKSALLPDTISFYGYAHVPWHAPRQKKMEMNSSYSIPMGEEKWQLYDHGRSLLLVLGYKELGLDHFSLPSDPLWKAYEERKLIRNFMGYTLNNFNNIIGLGVSSISNSSKCYIQNEKDIRKYHEELLSGKLAIIKGHSLSSEDSRIAKIIQSIMCYGEVEYDPNLFTSALPTPISTTSTNTPYNTNLHNEKLAEAISDGIITVTGNKIKVTSKGKPFLRNVAMIFDPHFSAEKKSGIKTPLSSTHSQTI